MPDTDTEIAELAGGFIHEVKNHLSTFNLNLQLLADDFAAPQTPRERKAKQRIDRLSQQAQKLVDVSNDFLRFARARQVTKKPENMADVLDDMTDFVGPTMRAANITLRSYPDPDLPPIPMDRELFKQAILNLLLNAEQAMPDGGEIVLQSRRDGANACVDVIDTGAGIDAPTMAILFRPFHTTKPGGTGLGLATSRKILRAHGGDITVQSEPGCGTKFTLCLPLAGV